MLRQSVRLPAIVFAVSFLLLAGPTWAANPASGTLSPQATQLTYTGGPFSIPNNSDLAGDGTSLACSPASPCDDYALKLQLPADFTTTNPNAKVRITLSTDANSDYDLYVVTSTGSYKVIGVDTGPTETVEFNAGAGTQNYTVRAVPFEASGVYSATITLTGVAPTDTDGDGVPDSSDLCAATPPGTTVDAHGCPVTVTDSDGDGVIDANDACPGTPAGTPVDATGCAPAATLPEIVLHFHGNSHETPTPCSGTGNSDFAICSGPFLKESGALDPSAPAAHFDYNELSGSNGQGPYDANWTWKPTAATTVAGYTVVNFWASCNATCALVGGNWDARVYKNNTVLVYSTDLLQATPSTPDAPSLLSVHFTMPAATKIDLNGTTDTLTLKLEAHYSDTGANSRIYYDSVSACPGSTGTAACDSTVRFNAVAPPPPPPPPPPTPATGLAPRYQVHVSPAALGNDAGEPSVGFNPFSQHTMFISYTQALRQTYQEDVVPPLLPASCDALWEDKSGTLTTVNSLDPILFTDPATGRTFNSQLSGDNSLMEFTDDDGENWTPAQKGPPNGGADHQAVATGVYPAGSVPPTASWPATGPKRAVYYCSQSVAGAFCSRSDDGAATFGPGFPFKNTDCAAGALHGHVKVAPDGTAYVPDSSQCVLPTGETANHVVAFASDNAGQTWTVREVPQSTGGDGSDPSIGIATDGTLYMCYTNADSTVHMVWSSDKGQHWSGGVDLGAALGITQTRFPQAIAGDPDRASCAFLGTTGARPESPSNDGNSLDFQGVWYGYQATTYDHGASWHLVNVTPNDPVQGWGGICCADNSNRNLLDFNDLQTDDEGRTLFAFADGCTGACVKDPSKNSFAAKATIVRQTGGRTLLSAYDDVATSGKAVPRFNKDVAIEPAAACARTDLSSRSVVQSKLFWNAPDTGGSPITNYKVWRATDAAGPFAAIADAGAKTSYNDTTTSPSVEKYYYRIEADNVKGVADLSNTLELAITADEVNTCSAPGEIIVQDSTGDVSPAGTDDLDIVYIGVAESAARPDEFVFTEKVVNFTAGVPPSSSFYVLLFPLYNNLYIALDSTNGPATFVYGTFQEDPAGQGFLIYTQSGTLAHSSFAADGTITFVVPRSMFGNPAVGSDIVGFDARVRVGASSANSRDTAGPSSYTVKGSAICSVVDPIVLASLAASDTQGHAPLNITFTISGTPSEGRTMDSWSLLFGDESSSNPTPSTGSFGGLGSVQVSHTYQSEGTYRARLTVSDSGAHASSNLAEQTITVLAPGTGSGSGGSGSLALGDNKVAGGLSPFGTLILGIFGLLRRRRPRRQA